MKSPEQLKRIAEERTSPRVPIIKCDRVYELHANGVSNEAIADRLGINPRAVSTMIKQGRERKEAMK